VRREHEADERVGPAGKRLLDRLGDPRPPVLHADEDRHPSSHSSAARWASVISSSGDRPPIRR
jgi:hypothetical protein